MTRWAEIARETIERVALTVPEGVSFKERKALIEAAYPFGMKDYWPRRAWCKARRRYLAPFDPKPAPPLFASYSRDPKTGRPVIA